MPGMWNAARQEVFSPVETGVNAHLMTASFNSSGIGCSGFNQLTLEFDYTYVAGTTAITFFLEVNDLKGASGNWRRIQTDSVAAGVATLTDLQFSKAVSAASLHFAVNIPLNYENIRVATIAISGSPTTDAITMTAILGVV